MTKAGRTLSDRYVVPPFSILDAKQGYWQARKRAWLELGVDDSTSRQSLEGTGSVSGTDPKYYNEKALVEHRLKRRLTHKEFQSKYYVPHAGSRLRSSNSGAIISIFDPVLCEIAYRWFCPPGGHIIDPFAGGAVRGIVASLLDRRYTGVDLSGEQVKSNRKTWGQLSTQVRRNFIRPAWRIGDSRNVLRLAHGEYDFLFTCPPYGDLERYSNDIRDISGMSHDDFLASYRQIISASTAMLKQDRFATIVVGDFRAPNGFYRNFVSNTIAAFEGVGLRLYNEAILATMLGSLPVRAARPFDSTRKLGKTHQNVLVFVKGDPKKATAAVGPIVLPIDPEDIATIGKRRAKRTKPKLAAGVHVYQASGERSYRRAVA